VRILVLSPYQAYSHRIWVEQLVAGFPAIEWTVITLPARHFSWRIRSNPLQWHLQQSLSQIRQPDIILATSMTDLATFKGIFHHRFGGVPVIAYFHENQFAYPMTPGATDSIEPRMINLYTAMSADRVVFNSSYNRDSFFRGAREFLTRMPDRLPPEGIASIESRTDVIPVPIRDVFFEAARKPRAPPGRLVWNHRWEHDKGPDRLLAAVARLVELGVDFRLELAGQRFRRQPEALSRVTALYPDRVVDRGFMDEREYIRFLGRGGCVLSTAVHDFQGLAVLEAGAAGGVPVAPDRLAYPCWLDPRYLYAGDPDPVSEGRRLADRLAECLSGTLPPPPELEHLRFDALADRYRRLFNAMV